MNNTPLLSIITVNYNGLEDTVELLDSLQKYVSIPHEVIVVDNGSLVNEVILIQEKYPDIICIRSDKNLGFSGGNNLGIRRSKGTYIFLINNDTVVKDNSMIELIQMFESNPNIGGISPMIKYADGSNIIQYAGSTPLSAITLRNSTIGLGDVDRRQYNSPQKTTFLHGAAMMLRREVIDIVGFMPEVFFLYYEEMDWSTQMINKGYDIWYNPLCIIYHKESRSVGRESSLKVFYMTRNRLLYAWRNRSGLKKFLSLAYLFLIATPRNMLKALSNKRVDLVQAIYRGNIAFLKLKSKQN